MDQPVNSYIAIAEPLPEFTAPISVSDARLKICKTCDKYALKSICSVCKCFMPVKTKFKDVSCPDGKW